jgi:5-methylcytosine-specific restriction endonuclease McrA
VSVPRPCLHREPGGAGCTRYALTGGSYCAAHGGLRSPSSTTTRRMPHRRRRARLLRHGLPWTCANCFRLILDASEVEVDHATPLARGGADDDANARVLCRKCNRSKGAT